MNRATIIRSAALVVASVGIALPATATWTWVEGKEGTQATDGSWKLTLAEDEIDGVAGLKMTGQSMGTNTDLDLSTFETDLG